ncbi:MAG: OmpA family protein [Mucilaginibacter sp.]
MLLINKIKKLLALSLILISAHITVQAQIIQPTWWFGLSGAANANFYDGTTQTLNSGLVAPTALHKGFGVRPYGSILMEYRPASVWGAMLNVGYDGSGGKFNEVIAPCNCPTNLKTDLSYAVIEPSVRLNMGKSSIYLFAGPSVSFNLTKNFTYTQLKQPDTRSEFNNVQNTLFSGQVGLGADIKTSSPTNLNQVSISPFVSFHPYFGREPRSIESWSITTVRAGIAIKFGKAHKAAQVTVATPPLVIPEREIGFAVRAPKEVPLKRQVSETLPLLNSVFFDDASVNIPNRYVLLTKDQASGFSESSLQKESTENMTGRSARQLNVYHNVLNIIGDRMRANPGTTILLTGASPNLTDGKAFAESVKQYLVTIFGIDGSRITTDARKKPMHPSEQPGGDKELVLLRAEDTRVDITSTSPELLLEVGGDMMKPVQFTATQFDPLDSHVIFNVDGGKEVLSSWMINTTDAYGVVQHFGPFTGDMQSVPGAAILGNNPTGDYKVTLIGTTKKGNTIQKESTVHLVRNDDKVLKGLRYSIVFDFDRSRSIESYNKFLSETVAPLIADGSTVIIHGHTDIIGEPAYNQTLSNDRALQTQKMIEQALNSSGKKNVKFETSGFGEDTAQAPFDNNLPEERFYNRTVIIDIILN